jgi:foldase protein PrsA
MLNFFRERAKEIIFGTLLLFTFSFLGIGAYSFLNRGEMNNSEDNIYSNLALVNGVPLDVYYYNRQFNQLLSAVPSEQRMLLDPDIIEHYRYQAFQETVSHMLMLEEAKRQNIKVYSQEINYRIDQIVQAYSLQNTGQLKKLLKENNISWQEFKDNQSSDILVSKFLNGLLAGVRVTPLDKELAFTEFKVRHILIKVAENVSDNIEEDINKLKKAEAIYERVLSDVRNFPKLAQQYSEDTFTATKGGDLGWISRGQMVVEFEKTLQQLSIGDIGGPIKTIFGYHIMLLEDKREKDIPANLSDEQIDRMILQQKQQEAIQEWLKPFKASADIEIIDSQLKGYEYRVQQKFEDALVEYRKAQSEKNDLLLFIPISRILDRSGENDEAVRIMRKALILQNRLQNVRYPSLYFAGIDLFLKYKNKDLYNELLDEVIEIFQEKEFILEVVSNNYRENMTVSQNTKLDAKLLAITNKQEREKINPSVPFSDLDSFTDTENISIFD